MANVKLTWIDNSSNEQGFKVYRLSGTHTGATSEAASWVHEAAPSGINVDDAGASVSPLMTQDIVSGTTEKGLVAGTTEFVDTNVPVGSWTYRVSAFNDAGQSWCQSPAVQPVTITS